MARPTSLAFSSGSVFPTRKRAIGAMPRPNQTAPRSACILMRKPTSRALSSSGTATASVKPATIESAVFPRGFEPKRTPPIARPTPNGIHGASGAGFASEYSGVDARVVLHDVLRRCGVSHVFGVPGRSTSSDPFNTIYQSEAMTAIIPKQEQSAGHMAEGYARATGQTGVVAVSSPYGVPSLVTPMQDALMDGTPLVVLSSLCSSVTRGHDEFQISDTLSIAAACTKWSSRVTNVESLEHRIRQAFDVATNGRPGPVLLDIPAAILAQRLPYLPAAAPILPRLPSHAELVPSRHGDALDWTLAKVARLVDQAKKPVMYVGQGMLARPEGPAILKAFADKTNIPVTTSLQGLGAFNEHDPKALHMLGLHGAAYANLAVQEADLILALGARFDDRVTGSIPKFAPGALVAARESRGGIVHFDIAPKNIDKVVRATEAVIGDCAENLEKLAPMVKEVRDRAEWFSKIDTWKRSYPLSAYKRQSPSRVKPQAAIEVLSDLTAHMKDRVIISTGVGQHQMWAAQHYRWTHPRTMLTSGGLGTMGYGLPAAIAAKVARSDCLVVDIDGDASFSMNMNELATAVQYNIPVKVLLINNEEMGMVSDLQRFYFDKRFNQNRHVNPDFVLAAEAFGAAANRVTDSGDLEAKVKWLIDHDGPAVLEVVSYRDTPVYPIVPAGKGLDEFVTYPKIDD